MEAPRTPRSKGQNDSGAHTTEREHDHGHHRLSPFHHIGHLKKSAKGHHSPVSQAPNSPSRFPALEPHAATTETGYFAPRPTRPHHNVLHRLQALFPASNASSPAANPVRTGNVAPQIPELQLGSEPLPNPEHIMPKAQKKADPPFLKIRIITWNHGYTIPKGDLSTLLGHVPLYEPQEAGPSDTLPKFPADKEHPFHIVVVAGQECPSLNKVPLGIGAGMKRDLLEKMERKRSKGEGRSYEPPPTPGPYELSVSPTDARESASPSPATVSPPIPIPIRTSSPSPFQHMNGPSAHSLKSLASQANLSPHHAIGWSMMLEDWFCHGAGSLQGAKPTIVVDDTDAEPGVGLSSEPNLELPPQSIGQSPSPHPLSEGQETHVEWHESHSHAPIHPRHNKGPYVLFIKERLMAITLYIFVHRDAQHLITDFSKDTVKAGLIGGRIGNKGAIGISMKVAGTSLLFINAHLAAHEGKAQERVANMVKIKSELDVDSFNEPNDPRALAEDLTERIDHAFIFGDLNFRLNVTRLHAEWLISRKDYANALEFDQLKEVLKSDNNVFDGFSEAPINFDPTFKYDVLQTLKKHRSVRQRIHDKAARHMKHTKRMSGAQEEGDEGTSTSDSSSDEGEGHDAKSVSSSTWTGMQSHPAVDGDETAQDLELHLPIAAENARMNAMSTPFGSPRLLHHPAAHRAKEKLLGLLHRNTSAPMVPGQLSPAPPGDAGLHLGEAAPMTRSAQTSLDVPRVQVDPIRAPPIRRTQSIKSNGANNEHPDGILDTDKGVYDSSSKQRVPSWCDRILFKSTVPLGPEEPDSEGEHEHEHTRFPVFRVSQIFASFMRHRKESNHSIGSATEAHSMTSTVTPKSHEADANSPSSVDSTPTSQHPRRQSFQRHAFRGHRPERAPSVQLQKLPARRSSLGSDTGSRRSFSLSSLPSTADPSDPMVVPGTPSTRSPPPQQPGKLLHANTVHNVPATSTPNNRRWIFPFAGSSRDASPARSLPPPLAIERPRPVKHRRGEVVCIEYNTLDDRRMRQLEARSDHRPVIGDFAIYV